MISPNPASPNGTRARILILLTKNGPMTTAEIAEALGLTPKQVRDNSNQARHENLIASGRDDVTGTLAYSITPAGRDFVKALLSLGKPLAQDMTMLPKAGAGTSEETSAVAAFASDETQIPPAKCGGDCSCSGMSVEVEQSRKIITQQGNEIARLRVELDEAKEEAFRQENLAMSKHADCEEVMRDGFRQQGIIRDLRSDNENLRQTILALEARELTICQRPIPIISEYATRTNGDCIQIAGSTREDAIKDAESVAKEMGQPVRVCGIVPIGMVEIRPVFVGIEM